MTGLFYLIIGIAILYFSGNWLVSGSTSLARHLKVQPFIIALTLVAFGTSAPELAISINSALKGYEGITIGNILGSNIANVLFAIPLAFLIRIPTKSDIKLLDCFFLLFITIVYSVILKEIKEFNNYLGLTMLTILFSYIIFIIYQVKKGQRVYKSQEEIIQYTYIKSIIFSLFGILGVLIGAEILVKGAIKTTTYFNINETIIGLTIVAIGTSIPEVATTMIAAYRRQGNFILGAILGSNLFNLLGITGVASTITKIEIPETLVDIDIYFLIYSTLVFVLMVIFLKFLNKGIVTVLLISYMLYIFNIYLRI